MQEQILTPFLYKKEIIKTKRLVIVPFSKSHVLPAVETLNTLAVRKYLGGPKIKEDALDYFTTLSHDHCKASGHYWAVERLEDSIFLGYMCLEKHHEHDALEISFLFAEYAWGRGYAYEALASFIDYCRTAMELKELVAETQTANQASNRLLNRLGFTCISHYERFDALQNLYLRVL